MTDDIHFPTLTVGQTLEFAAKTRAPHKRPASWASKEEYIHTIVDILLTVFGLSHTRNTFVGDAAVRGVSGGEKKRVSIAEALATRSRIAAWDKYAFSMYTLSCTDILLKLDTRPRLLDSS